MTKQPESKHEARAKELRDLMTPTTPANGSRLEAASWVNIASAIASYTLDELDADNPYNAWMQETDDIWGDES